MNKKNRSDWFIRDIAKQVFATIPEVFTGKSHCLVDYIASHGAQVAKIVAIFPQPDGIRIADKFRTMLFNEETYTIPIDEAEFIDAEHDDDALAEIEVGAIPNSIIAR